MGAGLGERANLNHDHLHALMDCDFKKSPTPEKPTRLECRVCGKPLIPKRPEAPQARMCGVVAIERKPREPEQRKTFAAMPCPHRGESLGVVPCGACGCRDEPVKVAACDLHGACSERATARTDKQRVGGVVPVSCVACGDRP